MRFKFLFVALFAVLSLTRTAVAQNSAAALANLPEADALIYVSPQRILNEAAPRVIAPAELTKMRTRSPISRNQQASIRRLSNISSWQCAFTNPLRI